MDSKLQTTRHKTSQPPITQVKNDDGSPMILEVPFHDRPIYSYVWKVAVGRINPTSWIPIWSKTASMIAPSPINYTVVTGKPHEARVSIRDRRNIASE